MKIKALLAVSALALCAALFAQEKKGGSQTKGFNPAKPPSHGPSPVRKSPAPAPAAEKGKGKKGESVVPVAPNAYEFSNVIVNLAGTMGTRYLKTTFLVTGSDQKLNETFLGNKPKLVDITLNVLSSLTLAEIEEAGAKNIIREKLVNAYNQALGRKVVEQIYFSDFVVQ